jgi:tetratricopeptide (TPR) repeat protein
MFRPAALSLACTALLSTLAPACGRATPPAAPQRDGAFIAQVNRGVAQMGQYDFAGAVATFSTLADGHPGEAGVALNLALARVNRQADGDPTEAERGLSAIVGDAATGTRAKYALGLLRLHAGREAEAAQLLSEVAAATPGDAYPAYFAGQARLASAPAEALSWFTRAQAIDPRLRSAFYGAFQALQRLGRADEAAPMLAQFQALERDPRAALAEFKYTRMGPLAMAVTLDAPPTSGPAVVSGAAFAPPTPINTSGVSWRADGPASITVADIDGDGALDLFAAAALAGNAPNAVVIASGDGWTVDRSHPLAKVTDVNAALWGDIDEDGLLDAVLLRSAGPAIWRQETVGRWRDVTAAMRAVTPGVDAVDGALLDADHDGDLDVLLVNGQGATELLNNDGNGTFRRIAAEAGLAADGRPSRGVAVADLDGDRDHDLVVLKVSPPHEVFLNERVWRYVPATGVSAFTGAALDAVVAADADADGQIELYTSGPRGLERWQPGPGGDWQAARLAPPVTSAGRQLAVADVDGDGKLDLVASRGAGWAVWPIGRDGPMAASVDAATAARAWALLHNDPAKGPSLVAGGVEGLSISAPGPGRAGYLALAPTGREVASDQRRSNTSGIGTRLAVRTGSRWTAVDTVRTGSGPGQSLQPFSVGLGGAARADFVSLVWSDGILQTEIDLDAGRVHQIEETQRQLSSCPVLFAFDGTRFRFVTDILGVGGIGFLERPGVYSAPHPHERVLLPEGALAAHDGRYSFVLGEPMEEVTYLDRAAVTTYDLPPGWQMALDERKAIAGPTPSGAPIFFRHERLAARVTNDRGQDVTRETAAADLVAAPPGAVDRRFIGRTAPHALTLEFETPIERGPGAPVLMIDGWVEYPYAQTVFAAWQAGAPYLAPTLEARDAAGRWHLVAPEFGYPAGMPRRMTFPLSGLPGGTVALRLTTTHEIYWDRLAVVYAEAAPQVVTRQAPLAAATLRQSGFAHRTTGAQRTPHYDYDRRAPLLDTRHPRGWYSHFGPVTPLVERDDDAVAIFGPGEDVLLEFTTPDAPVPAGWTRRVVLDTRGWCKDMDLYTKDGETVAPLPGEDTPTRRALHAAFNTRYEGGR